MVERAALEVEKEEEAGLTDDGTANPSSQENTDYDDVDNVDEGDDDDYVTMDGNNENGEITENRRDRDSQSGVEIEHDDDHVDITKDMNDKDVTSDSYDTHESRTMGSNHGNNESRTIGSSHGNIDEDSTLGSIGDSEFEGQPTDLESDLGSDPTGADLDIDLTGSEDTSKEDPNPVNSDYNTGMQGPPGHDPSNQGTYPSHTNNGQSSNSKDLSTFRLSRK